MSDQYDNKNLLNQLKNKLRGDRPGGSASGPMVPAGPNHRITKKKINRIAVDPNNQGLRDIVKEEIVLNERGQLEEIEERTTFATTLEDGSPLDRQLGVVFCMTCGKLSSYSNLILCEACGRTCHVLLDGCGVYSKNFMGWVCRNCFVQLGG